MQADYPFDCPSIAYDLRNARNTDDFDAWFMYEHEEPSLPPSDIFSELSPNKENTQNDKFNKRRRQTSDENEKHRPFAPTDLKSVCGQQTSAPKRLTASRDSGRVTSSSVSAKQVRHMSSPRLRPPANRPLLSNMNDQSASNRPLLTVGKPVLTSASRLISSNRSQSACKSAARVASAAVAVKSVDNSLEQIIRQHNQKIAPVGEYVLRVHSGRDIKKWERISGRQWEDLKPQERNQVNEEISRLKETNTLG